MQHAKEENEQLKNEENAVNLVAGDINKFLFRKRRGKEKGR